MDFGAQINEYEGKTVGYYGGKFYPFHRGHLACIMKAQSQVDVLFVVVSHDDEHEKYLAEQAGNFEYVNHRIRERWISEELKNYPNIRVASHYEPRTDDYLNDPRVAESVNELDRRLGGIDKAFSSEPAYDAYFNKLLPNAEHVILFQDLAYSISATKIRNNFLENWDMLPKSVQAWYSKRVSICGVESSGKTHISKMLGSYFQTAVVEEYGRTYYENLGGFSEIDLPTDYNDIAAGQIHLLNEAQKETNRVLIADTDLIYTQYYHIRQHGYKNMMLEAAIVSRAEKIDHHIYLKPHNPHELDGTRNPVTEEQRVANEKQLLELYREYGVSLTIVDEPDREVRFEKAVEIVHKIINT